MHLIGYKAYQKGFFGCLEAEDRYVCFLFSRGVFRPITTYAKDDFESHDHFLATLHKFVPRHFFLLRPLPLKSLGAGDLAIIGQSWAPLTGSGARPGPGSGARRTNESGAG